MERFTKKDCKKQIKKSYKLYIKWKRYNNSFNSWIYKKDSINERIFPKTKFFRSKGKSFYLSNYAIKADLRGL